MKTLKVMQFLGQLLYRVCPCSTFYRLFLVVDRAVLNHYYRP